MADLWKRGTQWIINVASKSQKACKVLSMSTTFSHHSLPYEMQGEKLLLQQISTCYLMFPFNQHQSWHFASKTSFCHLPVLTGKNWQ